MNSNTTNNPTTSTISTPILLHETNKLLFTLQNAIKLCRPQNVINFTIRYLQDEKSSSSIQRIEENHAIHMLPFLITQPEEFYNVACTIFCVQQQHSITILAPVIPPPSSSGIAAVKALNDEESSGGVNGGNSTYLLEGNTTGGTGNTGNSGTGIPPVLPPPPSDPVTSANPPNTLTRRYYRESLDSSHVIDILQCIDFSNAYHLSHPLIDDYLVERIEKLKLINFDLFISSLRFVIGMYQIVCYVKDEIYDYMKVYESSTVELPISDEINVDIIKWKSFMMK